MTVNAADGTVFSHVLPFWCLIGDANLVGRPASEVSGNPPEVFAGKATVGVSQTYQSNILGPELFSQGLG